MLLAAHSVSLYVTALSVCLGIASLLLIARNGLMRLPLALLSIWFAALVIVVFVSDPAMVTTLLGRDPTLTKRTVIWAFALQMIEARPLLGYGYGVFWDSVGSVARVVNAHNGYLTVILDLGVLGAILLFALLARVSWQCCSVVLSSPVFVATWPAAVLLGLMVNNLTEAELFSPNGVQWCLLVIVAGICQKAKRPALANPGTRRAFGPRPVGV
jgi:O-antigen ligase